MRGVNAARPSRFPLNPQIRPEPSCPPKCPPIPPIPRAEPRPPQDTAHPGPGASPPRGGGADRGPPVHPTPREPPNNRIPIPPGPTAHPPPAFPHPRSRGGLGGRGGQVRPYLIPGGAERCGRCGAVRGRAGGAELGEAPARPRAAASRPRPPALGRDFPAAPPPPLEGGTGGSPRPPGLCGAGGDGTRREGSVPLHPPLLEPPHKRRDLPRPRVPGCTCRSRPDRSLQTEPVSSNRAGPSRPNRPFQTEPALPTESAPPGAVPMSLGSHSRRGSTG
ncbi:proline-rich protein HaeIII subfamily 1-like [Ammospiza caudacuta]|uniref:proline-rich protein HaeIII subfamily 1-like n=1 Tax=Ammospiza caudacuta TaxID=2857398 RepID=UPI00273A35ED|nr:proline-rich protein HaeIII subfamily 1-like [Ammospiza caudacuta]